MFGNDLFEWDERKQSRNTDPNTSYEAARRIAQSVKGHKRIVIDTLERFGPLTPEQIANNSTLTFSQVWRRTSDLKRDGVLYETGEERANSNGYNAKVVALVEGVNE